ncbi:hypothetical protein AAG906_039991 [Vitis piasezkii]
MLCDIETESTAPFEAIKEERKMTGRGAREVSKDYPPRFEEKSHSGRSSHPPSRHLWVGNLSHSISENTLTDPFLQFGELDTVAFQPGRSYAFINFKQEEDAIHAMRSLQGFSVAGMPLKIEFAKAEKSSTASRDEDYLQRRDEQRSTIRGSPFSQRDSRTRHGSPDTFYPDKSSISDRKGEPCEVLWIGFPSLLKVDETILRKAFSPFGEIEKITSFPGRSYAFVQFRSVTAACRAKETLQGKLFGNPRVHICFAKSEPGPSNGGRNAMNAPPSPHFQSNSRLDLLKISAREEFWELPGDPSVRSPRFISNLETEDSDVIDFGRKSTLWTDGNGTFEHRRSPFYEDPWDLPEDAYLFHGAKKLKLPGSFGYKQMSDHPMNLTRPHGEMSEQWKASYDGFQVGSGSLSSNPVDWKRLTPESHPSSLSGEWKWEGTIAKGGSSICRARCFPVGKVMDIMLPEFLDCTARTGLDMLAKHYYQAASAWVVFFVPESDADIGYYNEFMNYLGRSSELLWLNWMKEPHCFSYPIRILREGSESARKLSISGVVLRLENPGSNFGSLDQPQAPSFMSFHGDTQYPKPTSPSGLFPPMASFPNFGKSGVSNVSYTGNVPTSAPPTSFSGSAHAVGGASNSINENSPEYLLHQRNPSLGPNWSPHHLQNSISGTRNVPLQASNSAVDTMVQDYQSIMQKAVQGTGSSHYQTGNSGIPLSGSSKLPLQEIKPSVSLPMPVSLQPEQLAQLASSLLGQQRQSGSSMLSGGEDFRQPNTMNPPENQFRTAQKYALQNHQVSTELSTSQFGQVQQQQQQTPNVPVMPHTSHHREVQTGVQGNQPLQSTETQEEVEADPQKRLQATLQLAAALLQQIQQGKGT